MILRKERSSQRCSSTSKVTASLLLAFLAAPGCATLHDADRLHDAERLYGPNLMPAPIRPQSSLHDFTLRHVVHRGTYQDPHLHLRYDVPPPPPPPSTSTHDFRAAPAAQYIHIPARSRPSPIERLADRQHGMIEQHLSQARLTGRPASLDASAWTVDEVWAPDITDRDTIINLAVMTSNAYVVDPNDADWRNVTQGYNESKSFGWEGDGLRGHIFADQNNETIIVSLKGTSPAVFDGDGTTTKDKLNDNLFFSCCCAQGGQYFWRQVCDCSTGTYACNATCLQQALGRENRYYRASIDLYTNITEYYPNSNVWLVGHSLGGAVSSLLGLTFGLPVVTYEAPGDDLAAQRLGLPQPPSPDPGKGHRRRYAGSVHVGHTADPIFMGTCNGATATCTLGGYAMESQCHSGLQCVYDTVGDLGWRVGIGNHKIHNVIDQVLRQYQTVPECVPDDECVDCYNWKYFKSNGSDRTTTTTVTTPSSTRTRTSTCKTPGWWGCLDDSSSGTATTTTPVVTTTYTTTTCLKPGWFGCNESKNLTITTTTAPPTTTEATTTSDKKAHSRTASSTCKTPGWFGCDDPAPSSTHPFTSASRTASSSSTCETPGLFFGCHDKSHSTSHSITSAPTTPATSSAATSTPTSSVTEKCKHPILFGLICLDRTEEEVDFFNRWS